MYIQKQKKQQNKQKGVRELTALFPDDRPPKSSSKSSASKAGTETRVVTNPVQLKHELEKIIEEMLRMGDVSRC